MTITADLKTAGRALFAPSTFGVKMRSGAPLALPHNAGTVASTMDSLCVMRPLSRYALGNAFQARVEQIAQRIMDHLPPVDPFAMFKSLNYWRDWAIKFGRGDEGISDALSCLVRDYGKIHSNRDLWEAMSKAFGKKDGEGNLLRDSKGDLIFQQEVYDRLHWALKIGLSNFVLFKIAVWQIAQRFVVGTTIENAVPRVVALEKKGVGVTLDFPGEATKTDELVAKHFNQYYSALSSTFMFRVKDKNMSCKLTGLTTDLMDAQKREVLMENFRQMLRAMKGAGLSRLTIDMEEFMYKDLTLSFFKEVLGEKEFSEQIRLEIVIQSYLKDALADVEKMDEWAAKRKLATGAKTDIRLVKGAYYKHERAEALRLGYPDPICGDGSDPRADKAETDRNFERVARFLLEHHDRYNVAFGTHNLRSICAVIAMAEELNIPMQDLEFQMLLGMSSEPIAYALRAMGCKVTFYALDEQVDATLGYLARRMIENKDMNSCFNDFDAYLEGKIPLWQLVLPPGVKVDAHV